MNELTHDDAHSFLRCIIDAMENPVFIKNQKHQWILFNDAFCRLMGRQPEELYFRDDRAIFPEAQASVFWRVDDAVFRDGLSIANEEEITDGTGAVRWFLTIKAPFTFQSEVYLVGVITDISERKRAEAAARVLALEDSLTGLPNRRLLQEQLQCVQTVLGREERAVALMIIDLDDFKHINDALGHSVGDRFLVEIANRLRRLARGSDIVARLGGDEFAILATTATKPEEFGALAERLVTHLCEPVLIGELSVRSSASVGVAIGSTAQVDADTLLAQADLALYASKSAGKNTWCFFEAAMQQRACMLVELEQELHQAVRDSEFVLHYQPILNVSDHQPVEFEALIRWNHPSRGLLLPGEFLEAVERNRLIVPMTFWIIGEALREAAVWIAAGVDAGIAVNLATAVFEIEGIVEHIVSRLQAEGLSPQRLTVEVTEGAMGSRSKAVSVLERLRQLGVRVAIDDFGAGHSSLGRLDQIPVDVLKIDRMFIASATERRKSILHATIDLARSLGLQTVVEGVETDAQFALAKRYAADGVQGFLLATPMPSREIPAWFRILAKQRLSGEATDSLLTSCVTG